MQIPYEAIGDQQKTSFLLCRTKILWANYQAGTNNKSTKFGSGVKQKWATAGVCARNLKIWYHSVLSQLLPLLDRLAIHDKDDMCNHWKGIQMEDSIKTTRYAGAPKRYPVGILRCWRGWVFVCLLPLWSSSFIWYCHEDGYNPHCFVFSAMMASSWPKLILFSHFIYFIGVLHKGHNGCLDCRARDVANVKAHWSMHSKWKSWWHFGKTRRKSPAW